MHQLPQPFSPILFHVLHLFPKTETNAVRFFKIQIYTIKDLTFLVVLPDLNKEILLYHVISSCIFYVKNKQGRIERNTNGSIGLHNLSKPICYFNTLYDCRVINYNPFLFYGHRPLLC
jgi:hypothetical protein